MNRNVLLPLLSGVLLAGCSLPLVGTAPAGEPSLTVQPSLQDGALRSVSSVVPRNTASSVGHVVLKLFDITGSETAVVRNGTPVQADVASTSLYVPVTFNLLRPNTSYRIRAYAYRATGEATSDLMSTLAGSYVDVAVGTNLHPAIATLPIRLADSPFSGQGTGSINVFAGGLVHPTETLTTDIAPSVSIVTIGGTGISGSTGDGGPATSALIGNPKDIARDAAGNLYFFSTSGTRFRKIDPSGTITAFAGNGTTGFSGDGGPAANAQFSSPYGVACDGSGSVYIADGNNGRVRKVASNGVISTYAGGGTTLGDGGPATSGKLVQPRGLAFDRAGNLYVADFTDNRVRKIATNGTISTVIGTGVGGNTGDGGLGTAAQISQPNALVCDSSGSLYVAGWTSCTIRKLATNGTITTIAGTYGNSVAAGDGGLAASASFFSPRGLAVDASGSVYLATGANNQIRKIAPNGIITTLAGTGVGGFNGGVGAPETLQLNYPWGLAIGAQNGVYVADYNNNRVREILQP